MWDFKDLLKVDPEAPKSRAVTLWPEDLINAIILYQDQAPWHPRELAQVFASFRPFRLGEALRFHMAKGLCHPCDFKVPKAHQYGDCIEFRPGIIAVTNIATLKSFGEAFRGLLDVSETTDWPTEPLFHVQEEKS
ncbi:hypothetical protein HAX54_019139 [Datura stramonium]|uniref:Uncharacterized protein n=1 Tax=Datura stramonium TaxID=4076 RepID=A0ABS8UQR8_DATST|nr:hypothetical protein [Datura stramonium]